MHIKRLTGGVLFIAGTCIGAGMLALPVTLGRSGFWVSMLLLVACWLATYLCGLYVLEANLCIEEDSNYVSMSRVLLGRPGEVVAWVTYLLLLYSLMAAYLTGGGGIVRDVIQTSCDVRVSPTVSAIPWIVIASAFIYLGTRFVDGLNRVLIIGLLATYGALVMISLNHTHGHLINGGHSGHILAALPVLSTAFGYHVIIPTLRSYMHGDSKKLAKTILLGSAIPLVIYCLWNFVVFGVIPIEGNLSLTSIYQAGGQPAELTNTLASAMHTPSIVTIAEFFIFFAIASSFLGIALSLFDFLADGFHISKSLFGKVLIALITFLPPFVYSVLYPKGFVLALSYAGVFVAMLHGILPGFMVLAARRRGESQPYQAPGGRIAVVLILALSFLVIGAQIAINFDWLTLY